MDEYTGKGKRDHGKAIPGPARDAGATGTEGATGAAGASSSDLNGCS